MKCSNPVFFNGRWMSAYRVSKLTGIPPTTIAQRAGRGLPLDQYGERGIKPKKYDFRGRMMSVSEVAALTGYDRTCIYKRIEGDRIRDVPADYVPRELHYITHSGKTLCASDWSRLTGIPRPTILYRLSKGWPVDKALTIPSGGQESASRSGRCNALQFRRPTRRSKLPCA